MQQMLLGHQIPSRIIDLGVAPYFGAGCPTALQVRSQDQWEALLILSPVEEQP
jgi:Na+-translocating ferredoxin:NAD+ oxidoreductase RnfC subunit